MVQQPARYTVGDVIKIGTANVTMNDKAKGPMIFRKLANSVALESPPVEGAAANDNEASSKMVADPKYFQPRWCPPGLTHSQKRKLQRLRAKEKREREAERVFNEMHPILPQSKRRARAAENSNRGGHPDDTGCSGGCHRNIRCAGRSGRSHRMFR